MPDPRIREGSTSRPHRGTVRGQQIIEEDNGGASWANYLSRAAGVEWNIGNTVKSVSEFVTRDIDELKQGVNYLVDEAQGPVNEFLERYPVPLARFENREEANASVYEQEINAGQERGWIDEANGIWDWEAFPFGPENTYSGPDPDAWAIARLSSLVGNPLQFWTDVAVLAKTSNGNNVLDYTSAVDQRLPGMRFFGGADPEGFHAEMEARGRGELPPGMYSISEYLDVINEARSPYSYLPGGHGPLTADQRFAAEFSVALGYGNEMGVWGTPEYYAEYMDLFMNKEQRVLDAYKAAAVAYSLATTPGIPNQEDFMEQAMELQQEARYLEFITPVVWAEERQSLVNELLIGAVFDVTVALDVVGVLGKTGASRRIASASEALYNIDEATAVNRLNSVVEPVIYPDAQTGRSLTPTNRRLLEERHRKYLDSGFGHAMENDAYPVIIVDEPLVLRHQNKMTYGPPAYVDQMNKLNNPYPLIGGPPPTLSARIDSMSTPHIGGRRGGMVSKATLTPSYDPLTSAVSMRSDALFAPRAIPRVDPIGGTVLNLPTQRYNPLSSAVPPGPITASVPPVIEYDPLYGVRGVVAFAQTIVDDIWGTGFNPRYSGTGELPQAAGIVGDLPVARARVDNFDYAARAKVEEQIRGAREANFELRTKELLDTPLYLGVRTPGTAFVDADGSLHILGSEQHRYTGNLWGGMSSASTTQTRTGVGMSLNPYRSMLDVGEGTAQTPNSAFFEIDPRGFKRNTRVEANFGPGEQGIFFHGDEMVVPAGRYEAFGNVDVRVAPGTATRYDPLSSSPIGATSPHDPSRRLVRQDVDLDAVQAEAYAARRRIRWQDPTEEYDNVVQAVDEELLAEVEYGPWPSPRSLTGKTPPPLTAQTVTTSDAMLDVGVPQSQIDGLSERMSRVERLRQITDHTKEADAGSAVIGEGIRPTSWDPRTTFSEDHSFRRNARVLELFGQETGYYWGRPQDIPRHPDYYQQMLQRDIAEEMSSRGTYRIGAPNRTIERFGPPDPETGVRPSLYHKKYQSTLGETMFGFVGPPDRSRAFVAKESWEVLGRQLTGAARSGPEMRFLLEMLSDNPQALVQGFVAPEGMFTAGQGMRRSGFDGDVLSFSPGTIANEELIENWDVWTISGPEIEKLPTLGLSDVDWDPDAFLSEYYAAIKEGSRQLYGVGEKANTPLGRVVQEVVKPLNAAGSAQTGWAVHTKLTNFGFDINNWMNHWLGAYHDGIADMGVSKQMVKESSTIATGGTGGDPRMLAGQAGETGQGMLYDYDANFGPSASGGHIMSNLDGGTVPIKVRPTGKRSWRNPLALPKQRVKRTFTNPLGIPEAETVYARVGDPQMSRAAQQPNILKRALDWKLDISFGNRYLSGTNIPFSEAAAYGSYSKVGEFKYIDEHLPRYFDSALENLGALGFGTDARASTLEYLVEAGSRSNRGVFAEKLDDVMIGLSGGDPDTLNALMDVKSDLLMSYDQVHGAAYRTGTQRAQFTMLEPEKTRRIYDWAKPFGNFTFFPLKTRENWALRTASRPWPMSMAGKTEQMVKREDRNNRDLGREKGKFGISVGGYDIQVTNPWVTMMFPLENMQSQEAAGNAEEAEFTNPAAKLVQFMDKALGITANPLTKVAAGGLAVWTGEKESPVTGSELLPQGRRLNDFSIYLRGKLAQGDELQQAVGNLIGVTGFGDVTHPYFSSEWDPGQFGKTAGHMTYGGDISKDEALGGMTILYDRIQQDAIDTFNINDGDIDWTPISHEDQYIEGEESDNPFTIGYWTNLGGKMVKALGHVDDLRSSLRGAGPMTPVQASAEIEGAVLGAPAAIWGVVKGAADDIEQTIGAIPAGLSYIGEEVSNARGFGDTSSVDMLYGAAASFNAGIEGDPYGDLSYAKIAEQHGMKLWGRDLLSNTGLRLDPQHPQKKSYDEFNEQRMAMLEIVNGKGRQVLSGNDAFGVYTDFMEEGNESPVVMRGRKALIPGSTLNVYESAARGGMNRPYEDWGAQFTSILSGGDMTPADYASLQENPEWFYKKVGVYDDDGSYRAGYQNTGVPKDLPNITTFAAKPEDTPIRLHVDQVTTNFAPPLPYAPDSVRGGDFPNRWSDLPAEGDTLFPILGWGIKGGVTSPDNYNALVAAGLYESFDTESVAGDKPTAGGDELHLLPVLGDKTGPRMADAGYDTFAKIAELTVDEVLALKIENLNASREEIAGMISDAKVRAHRQTLSMDTLIMEKYTEIMEGTGLQYKTPPAIQASWLTAPLGWLDAVSTIGEPWEGVTGRSDYVDPDDLPPLVTAPPVDTSFMDQLLALEDAPVGPARAKNLNAQFSSMEELAQANWQDIAGGHAEEGYARFGDEGIPQFGDITAEQTVKAAQAWVNAGGVAGMAESAVEDTHGVDLSGGPGLRETAMYVLRSRADNEVFYVGQTVQDPNKRIKQHVDSTKKYGAQHPKIREFYPYFREGESPAMDVFNYYPGVVGDSPSYDEADLWEKLWIGFFLYGKKQPMANVADILSESQWTNMMAQYGTSFEQMNAEYEAWDATRYFDGTEHGPVPVGEGGQPIETMNDVKYVGDDMYNALLAAGVTTPQDIVRLGVEGLDENVIDPATGKPIKGLGPAIAGNLVEWAHLQIEKELAAKEEYDALVAEKQQGSWGPQTDISELTQDIVPGSMPLEQTVWNLILGEGSNPSPYMFTDSESQTRVADVAYEERRSYVAVPKELPERDVVQTLRPDYETAGNEAFGTWGPASYANIPADINLDEGIPLSNTIRLLEQGGHERLSAADYDESIYSLKKGPTRDPSARSGLGTVVDKPVDKWGILGGLFSTITDGSMERGVDGAGGLVTTESPAGPVVSQDMDVKSIYGVGGPADKSIGGPIDSILDIPATAELSMSPPDPYARSGLGQYTPAPEQPYTGPFSTLLDGTMMGGIGGAGGLASVELAVDPVVSTTVYEDRMVYGGNVPIDTGFGASYDERRPYTSSPSVSYPSWYGRDVPTGPSAGSTISYGNRRPYGAIAPSTKVAPIYGPQIKAKTQRGQPVDRSQFIDDEDDEDQQRTQLVTKKISRDDSPESPAGTIDPITGNRVIRTPGRVTTIKGPDYPARGPTRTRAMQGGSRSTTAGSRSGAQAPAAQPGDGSHPWADMYGSTAHVSGEDWTIPGWGGPVHSYTNVVWSPEQGTQSMLRDDGVRVTFSNGRRYHDGRQVDPRSGTILTGGPEFVGSAEAGAPMNMPSPAPAATGWVNWEGSIEGLGAEKAGKLYQGGLHTWEDVKEATDEEIMSIGGVDAGQVQDIRNYQGGRGSTSDPLTAMPFGGSHDQTQSFGVNPERYKSWGGHMGLDFSMPIGTDLLAVMSGTVLTTGTAGNEAAGYGGFGNYVAIQGEDGYITEYAHLSNIGVQPGQSVSAGDVLGQSGHTGVSDFPHLHFGVRKDGKYVDPTGLLMGESNFDTTSSGRGGGGRGTVRGHVPVPTIGGGTSDGVNPYADEAWQYEDEVDQAAYEPDPYNDIRVQFWELEEENEKFNDYALPERGFYGDQGGPLTRETFWNTYSYRYNMNENEMGNYTAQLVSQGRMSSVLDRYGFTESAQENELRGRVNRIGDINRGSKHGTGFAYSHLGKTYISNSSDEVMIHEASHVYYEGAGMKDDEVALQAAVWDVANQQQQGTLDSEYAEVGAQAVRSTFNYQGYGGHEGSEMVGTEMFAFIADAVKGDLEKMPPELRGFYEGLFTESPDEDRSKIPQPDPLARPWKDIPEGKKFFRTTEKTISDIAWTEPFRTERFDRWDAKRGMGEKKTFGKRSETSDGDALYGFRGSWEDEWKTEEELFPSGPHADDFSPGSDLDLSGSVGYSPRDFRWGGNRRRAAAASQVDEETIAQITEAVQEEMIDEIIRLMGKV